MRMIIPGRPEYVAAVNQRNQRMKKFGQLSLRGDAFSLVVLLLVTASALASESPRRSLSLDGVWQIAEGKMDQAPAHFDRTAPVPGLVSLATPPFADPPGPKVANRNQVPQKDPQRDAFWYRRVFRIDQPLPAVALLKIHKAMFGARVVLNGQAIGDHAPCFTPGYFDARAALKSGENELLIRVGADRDAVGPAIPSGFDYEKERYIPGIFDSVELILSGTPHFTQVQAVPDLAGKAVRVQAVLHNQSESVRVKVAFVVREAKSRKVVGRLAAEAFDLPNGADKTLDVSVRVGGCHLWSPEDPFLYTLEADSGSDRVETRFGMRELRFDPATGHARLNGKPYFLRGSNITLYRFFEDSECQDLPWKQDWVRRLHQRVKDMNWNCLRYCIGFPPERWYDMADELGILIQDEFPIWHGSGSGWGTWPKELKTKELAVEYSEWMRERWNHPCVMVWDANNETSSTETAPAIREVRGLDLSNRPWDNSYTAPMEPGDVFESHPYHFQNANFKLRDLARADPVPQGNAIHNDGQHAVIINEYGWLWLNRDGSPTTLTSELYSNLLGANATIAGRFHLQASYIAAETEFWRSHRRAAAVMHFTTLGYARPDGQTSDHWRNVTRLEWEPEFYRAAREAFAPVGLMVDYWSDRAIQGAKAKVTVRLINDLDRHWSGPVTLRVMSGDTAGVFFAAKQDCRMEPLGQTQASFELAWPTQSGNYLLVAELRGADGKPVHSSREVKVVEREALGLAFQKTATASSVYADDYKPENGVDGDPATYWSSSFADPAWFLVDLGEIRKVSRVSITWQTAYSKAFSVQISRDGQSWADVYATDDGKGGVSEIRFLPLEARWVRLNGTQRATQWGHAICEFQVFE